MTFLRMIFSKREREIASTTPLLRDSIGDQIIALLQKESNKKEQSHEKIERHISTRSFA